MSKLTEVQVSAIITDWKADHANHAGDDEATSLRKLVTLVVERVPTPAAPPPATRAPVIAPPEVTIDPAHQKACRDILRRTGQQGAGAKQAADYIRDLEIEIIALRKLVQA